MSFDLWEGKCYFKDESLGRIILVLENLTSTKALCIDKALHKAYSMGHDDAICDINDAIKLIKEK